MTIRHMILAKNEHQMPDAHRIRSSVKMSKLFFLKKSIQKLFFLKKNSSSIWGANNGLKIKTSLDSMFNTAFLSQLKSGSATAITPWFQSSINAGRIRALFLLSKIELIACQRALFY